MRLQLFHVMLCGVASGDPIQSGEVGPVLMADSEMDDW